MNNDKVSSSNSNGTVSNSGDDKPKRRCGFALLPKDKVVELAIKGSRVSRERGTVNKWNSETAKIAGAKGGRATQAKLRGDKVNK